MVSLQRRGTLLDVIALDPETVRELSDVLNTSSHELENGQNGCQLAVTNPAICSVEPWHNDSVKSVLTTLRGFEPVVTKVLTDCGIEIDRRNLVPSKLESVGVGLHMAALTEAVRAGGNLLVRHGTCIEPAALAAEICRAFAREQIAVACARRGDVLTVRDELRARRLDVVAITPNGEPVESGRVVVGTFSTMGCGCASIERRRLVIPLNVRELLNEAGRLMLTHAEIATVIGLLPFEERLAPRELDLLRGFVGFQEVAVPTYGTTLLPVSTVWISIEAGPPVESVSRDDLLLRRYVWQNANRNRQIKRVVDAIFNADAGLWVAIFAESVEHARILQRQVPGSAVVTRPEEFELSLPGHSFLAPRAMIVTGAVVNHVPWACLDVLIRADGGVGLPSSNILETTTKIGSEEELLIVDFDDRFHPEFRRRSRWRREEYANAGWFPPGVDAVTGRVDEYIAAKRKGAR